MRNSIRIRVALLFVLAGVSYFAVNPAIRVAALPGNFHCTALQAEDYEQAGLANVTHIGVQSNGVCEAQYQDRQITISETVSDKISQIQFTNEYQNHLLTRGGYDVLKIGHQDSPCMELIINSPQIIAVTADNCLVTARVVYEIIDHKLG